MISFIFIKETINTKIAVDWWVLVIWCTCRWSTHHLKEPHWQHTQIQRCAYLSSTRVQVKTSGVVAVSFLWIIRDWAHSLKLWFSFPCPQLSGSGGGERLHVSGHGWHPSRRRQAGRDQREGRSSGFLRDAWGRRQFPVGTLGKTEPLSEAFFFNIKGNVTKLKCSKTKEGSVCISTKHSNSFAFFYELFFLLTTNGS